MKIDFNIPTIKKAKKNYDKATNVFYDCGKTFEKVVEKSGCHECEKFVTLYSRKDWTKIFNHCTGCKAEKKILEIQKEYIAKSQELTAVKKIYAEAIFDYLSPLNPKLYSRPEKKHVLWNKAFPKSFNDVPEILYASIIALVEQVGGRYTLED